MIRIIPCLDIRDGRVVKGIQFESLVDSGDPATLAARYCAQGADEIALLDIGATREGRRTILDSVRAVRDAVAIPIVVGGGIRSLEDASRLLDSGADRVSINSAAVRDPSLIERLAGRFGVQCVVVAVDARQKKPRKDGSGGAYESAGMSWEVVIAAGTSGTGLSAPEWTRECALMGAGEILLTSIDRDGTGLGYDLELIRAVSENCGIPVVASGGARSPEHFADGARAGARALLGAGVFHREELLIHTLKSYLAGKGLEVRQ